MQYAGNINLSDAPRFPALVARALVLIGGLNLNGLAFMALGHGQLFSPLLLLGSLYLILASGRGAGRDPLIIAFALFTMLHVGIGVLAAGAAASALTAAITYASSFLIIFALAAHVSSLRTPNEINRLIRFTKYVLLTSSAAVLASGKLASLYTVKLSSIDRGAGFFGNANEAGIVAATALALVLTAPSKKTWLNVAHVAIAVAAVFLSFSKSGILVSLLVVAVFSVRNLSGAKLLLAAAAIGATWIALGILSGEDAPRMSHSQKERLEQVQNILSGEVSSRTTTGRTELWSIAADRIEQKFLFGDGLGTFHHMVGGIMTDGVWMGAHNAYLMIWGEAGIFAFISLVFAMLLLLLAISRKSVHGFAFLYFIILQFDMISAHNVLALRFHNVLLGIVLGLAILGAGSARAGRANT